ncbi:hypothetical protein D3C81_1680390 [compost metagenome]
MPRTARSPQFTFTKVFSGLLGFVEGATIVRNVPVVEFLLENGWLTPWEGGLNQRLDLLVDKPKEYALRERR